MAAEVVETHGAVVLFVDDLAYKLKKPVRFDFMDFSTPELRRAALHRELELNRRLAPDVYLDVVDLVGSEGETRDSMLVMRRMPAERRLARLAQSGDEAGACITATAQILAQFHSRAATSDEISFAGSPDAVIAAWEANTREMEPFVGTVLDAAVFDRLSLASRYVEGRRRLFEERIAAGKIRDGHGDLLADDVFCLDDGPRILDCIEFDDSIRWCDVVSDAAFLAMDLERLGRSDLADRFLADYFRSSGEAPPPSLVDHYVAYRAQIRSKVACLRNAQAGDRAGEAASLLELCVRRLERSRIRLVIVGGLPGTGKSTLAAALSDETGYPVLRSDVVRKELAGIAPGAAAGAPMNEGIYSPEMTETTYAAMVARASELASRGESVILDASFSDERWRTAARDAGEDVRADVVELVCSCPRELAIRRAEGRVGDPSDAGAEVAAAMQFDDWPTAVVVDTTDDGLPTALSAL